MKRYYFLLLLIIYTFVSNAQKKVTSKSATPILNDLSVVLHEETLNKIFDAMGDITGTNEYSILLINGKYHWTVSKSRINLKTDSSDFTCEAKVDVGPFNYTTPVTGRVKIWYDNEKNFINVKVTTAIFELYTKVLGKKIHIKNIELAEYFTEPFQFEGPKTMGSEFEFTTPDSVVKKIYLLPCDCDMIVQSKQIVSRCEVKVSNQPFPIPNGSQNKNETAPQQIDDPKKKK